MQGTPAVCEKMGCAAVMCDTVLSPVPKRSSDLENHKSRRVQGRQGLRQFRRIDTGRSGRKGSPVFTPPTSALARHGLIDAIPVRLHVAPAAGHPPPEYCPINRVAPFRPRTFTRGRQITTVVGAIEIGVYTPERSIVDAYRLRHDEGVEVARGGSARVLARGGSPSGLLELAAHFHGAAPQLREDLQVLL